LALKRRRFTRACKLPVVRELDAGNTPAQVAREYQVHPTVLARWRHKHRQDAERAFRAMAACLKTRPVSLRWSV
jgi:transposase-like protein